MSDIDWQSNGGRRWYVHESGQIICEDMAQESSQMGNTPIHGGYLYRSPGEPTSMRLCLSDFRNDLVEAHGLFNIPIHWIMGMMKIEATPIGGTLHLSCVCVREEPGFTSDAATPNKVSPGLMQTLISTAQGVSDMLPSLPRPVNRYDLMHPRASILHGAAYMRKQLDKYGEDPVLLVGSYNAGGVYEDDNVWNLRTYSDTRVDRFCSYANDALAVLNES